MTTIYWPANIKVGSVDFGISYDVQINVRRSGGVYTFGLPGARWVATVTFDNDHEEEQRPRIEALIASLRGGARRLSMPHFGRPVPRGTLRGTPVLNTLALPGNNSVQLGQCNGGLYAGDIIGVGGQLLYVEGDASPSGGVMSVNVSPAVRNQVNAGTPVVWNRPEALWIPKDSTAGPFPYKPKIRPSFSVEFVEVPS